MLQMKLSFFEIKNDHRSSTVHPISAMQLLPSLSSCIRFQNQSDINEQAVIELSRHRNSSPVDINDSSNSESDEESELTYRNLKTTNLLSHNNAHGNSNDSKDEKWEAGNPTNCQVKHKPSLIRLLSWKVPNYARGTPLLNKASGEEGGDDIDNDRRCQLGCSPPRCSESRSDSEINAFVGSDRFEVGSWEKQKFISRDGELELETDISSFH